MASGAQLNRWGNGGGVPMATFYSGATAVTLPAYGTLGTNDSGAFVTPIGMTKWGFQLIGGGTGYEVTILGTLAPSVYNAYHGVDGLDVSATTNAANWFVLPGPSEQSGTGPIANPMSAGTPIFFCSMPLVAVRAVLTGATALTGQVTVLGFAVP